MMIKNYAIRKPESATIQPGPVLISVTFSCVHSDYTKSEKNKKRNCVETNSSSRLCWDVGKLLKFILKSTKVFNIGLAEGGCV